MVITSVIRCISDHHFTMFDGELGCDNTPQRGSYFCELHNISEEINDSYELEEE